MTARHPGPLVELPTWREPEHGIIAGLAERCSAKPQHGVLHVLESRGREFRDREVSFEHLFAAAERAGGALEGAGARAGDRILMSLGDPRLFAAWFLGAVGRGMVPVIVPPLRGLGAEGRHAQRVAGILADCVPSLAVVERAVGWNRVHGHMQATPLIEGTAIDGAGAGLQLSDQPFEKAAFLQYTSGSTGEPKGVVVTHGNLAANLQAISCGMGVVVGERMISWLPLHHDMGLVGGLLWPMFAGGAAFIMTPLTFLSQPVMWLRAITRFGGTGTVAPNFAYSICARKIPDGQLEGLDLATLRLALCGAEPIDALVVRAFESRFGRYGFRPRVFCPVYGLAEATLAVAFHEPGAEVAIDVVDRRRLAAAGHAEPVSSESPHGQAIVSVGKVLPGHSINILDAATGIACADRQVGQVFVRGPSVSPRYWSEPPEVRRSALATGDLGYLVDGRLHLVDRVKDLVIIGGENYAPSDIEAAAAEVCGLRVGRVVAFGSRRADIGTDVAVIVAEVDPYSRLDPVAVRAAVATAVRSRVGLEPEVILVVPGTIEKTTSGKVRRGACAARYQAGALREVEDLVAVRRLRRQKLFARLSAPVRAALKTLRRLGQASRW